MSIDLSILIPVWNNEKEIPHAYERVSEVLSSLGKSFEILFIDDGSTDRTFSILDELSRGDSRVAVLKLKRNYGQHPALAAGIERARGGTLVTVDVDLQGDATDIPRFVDKVEEGYDLVSGWRIGRKAPLIRRRLPSLLINRLVGMVSGVKLHDYGCGMNALTQELGSQLKHCGDQRRFLKPLAASLARRVGEVQIRERRGHQKRSRYNMWRLFGLTLDLIISFSARPFRLVSLLGLTMIGLGGVGAVAYAAGRILLTTPASDRWQVMVLLLLFFGLQIVIVGLLGEFVVRIYHLQLDRPLFTVESFVQGDAAERVSREASEAR